MVLGFENKGYQTGRSGPGGGGRKAAAYGFFVVPRSLETSSCRGERLHVMNIKNASGLSGKNVSHFPN